MPKQCTDALRTQFGMMFELGNVGGARIHNFYIMFCIIIIFIVHMIINTPTYTPDLLRWFRVSSLSSVPKANISKAPHLSIWTQAKEETSIEAYEKPL